MRELPAPPTARTPLRPARRTALASALTLGALAALAGCSREPDGASATGTPAAASGSPSAASGSPSASAGASDGSGTVPGIDAALPYLEFPGGSAQPAHTLRVLLDFRCPYCQIFAQTNGEQLRAAAESGTARVRISPRPMLDAMLPGDYSLHSAAAYTAAFAQDPALAWEVERELFARQPAEDAAAPGAAEILSWLTPLGLDVAAAQRVMSGVYDDWLTRTVETECRALGVGTPTLYLDDQEISDRDWSDPAALQGILAG